MPVRVFPAVIDRLFRAVDGPTGVRLTQVGLRVESEAKRLCPVDTGRLRSSISTTAPVPRGANQLVIRIGSSVRYAIYVHEGTRFMPARPFLRQAVEREAR